MFITIPDGTNYTLKFRSVNCLGALYTYYETMFAVGEKHMHGCRQGGEGFAMLLMRHHATQYPDQV